MVKNVRARTNGTPIVMYGGSGVSRDDYAKAIKAGVRKINYFTYMDKFGGTAALEYLKAVESNESIFFSSIIAASREAMKKNVKSAIEMFAIKSLD